MKKFIKSIFDASMILQSLPSVLIVLLGMLFTSNIFKTATQHKSLSEFPFLLISSTILGFKGTSELGYVMHLSALRHSMQISTFKYIAVSNTCFILIQSFLIGIFTGILGVANVLLKGNYSFELCASIIVSSVSTCIASSLVFCISFIFSLETGIYLSINPENFLMPVLGTINDVLVVKILLMFSVAISKLVLIDYTWILLTVCAFTLLCVSILTFSEHLMPLQSLDTFLATMALNVITGFILERSSVMYKNIAPTFPVFSGLCASISFIFLHKKFTSLESQTILHRSTHFSLLFISFIVSLSYIFLARAAKIGLTHKFSICFVAMFITQTLIMIKITELLVKIMKKEGKSVSSDAVPVISSVSDFLASLSLIFTSIIAS